MNKIGLGGGGEPVTRRPVVKSAMIRNGRLWVIRATYEMKSAARSNDNLEKHNGGGGHNLR